MNVLFTLSKVSYLKLKLAQPCRHGQQCYISCLRCLHFYPHSSTVRLHACHMHQNLILCGAWVQTRKNRCHAALCIALARKYQICVTHDMWQKSESGGSSAAVWMCPCISICLSWLTLSGPSAGCVCLPVSACACHLSIIFSMFLISSTGLLHCSVCTNLLSFSIQSTCSSFSPSLLKP